MSSIPRLATAAVAAGLATATLIAAPAASAHPSARHHHSQQHSEHGQHKRHHHSATSSKRVLATGLLSPLRAAVSPTGATYVSENFAGKIDRVDPGGTTTTVYTDPHGYEVGGLSMAGRNIVFTVTATNQTTGENTDSWLKLLTPSGHVRTITDLHAYEAADNPDQTTTYGFRDFDPTNAADAACLATWPTADNGPATYTGAVDSHPYATYVMPHGWTYVADAGANDVLLVSPHGQVRTVATLPGIPLYVDAATASGMGLGSCFVGHTYYFEAVPTDVEVAQNGTIYVTSLPGGPEGPQLGARGSVFAISASSGYHGNFRLHPGRHHSGGSYYMHQARQVVSGLMSPTGLAVGSDGSLYVAQLFGNEVSKITLGTSHHHGYARHGTHGTNGATVTDLISTPTPGEVEWTPRGLYITSNVLSGTPEDPNGNTTTPDGQLIRYGR